MTTSPRPAIAFATSVVVFALIGATLGLLLTSCASSHSPGASSSHAADSTAEATAPRATNQSAAGTPSGHETTLPGGQRMYLATATQTSAVTVWTGRCGPRRRTSGRG